MRDIKKGQAATGKTETNVATGFATVRTSARAKLMTEVSAPAILPAKISAQAERAICDLLVFSFIPNHRIAERKAAFYAAVIADETIATFDHRDTSSLRHTLAQIVEEALRDRGRSKTLNAVSSGLDSRIALGATLDVLAPDRVFAFTHGEVGNRDFENAPRLVQARVRNHSRHRREFTGLRPGGPMGIQVSLNTSKEVVSGSMPPNDIISVHGRLGDAVSGGHLASLEAPASWDEAKFVFARDLSTQRKNIALMKSEGLIPEGYEPESALPDAPLLPSDVMHFDDQLDLMFRQHQMICLRQGGFDELNIELADRWADVEAANRNTIQPFVDVRWQKSFLQTPRDLRYGQKLYKRLAVEEYGDIFPDLVDPEGFEMASPGGPTSMDWTVMWKRYPEVRETVKVRLDRLVARGFQFDADRLIERSDLGHRRTVHIVKRLCGIDSRIEAGMVPGFDSE